jgi:hypothetical protein
MGDYQNTRFTLGGETPEDFVSTVQRVFGNQADAILEKYKNAFLNAPYYDAGGSSSAAEPEAPKQSGWGNSGGGGTSASSASSGKKEYPPDPGRPAGDPPECEHGPKEWRNPPNKDWKGWFCSAKKRAGSCATDWINDN